jgi:hypothetical protein
VRYAIYINWTRKRARYHKASCWCVEMHNGVAESARQKWYWRDTLNEVHILLEEKAAKITDQSPCRHCNPE